MARRRRNTQTNFLEDLFEIASRIPWWIGVLIAVAIYVGLHHLAGMPVTPAKKVQGIVGPIASGLIKAFATFGQYVLPIPFLLGSIVSAWHSRRTSGASRESKKAIDRLIDDSKSDARSEEKIEPTLIKSSSDLYEKWKSDIPEVAQQGVPKDRWSIELLRVLEWRRFEEVCSGLFERLGFSTKTTRFGADGGVDIHLFKHSTERPDVIVQCKAWNSYKVGIKLVRELLGVMASTGVPEGIFITTGTFTKEARDFGAANKIDCMDGESLLSAIRGLSTQDQISLLHVATAGDYLTPTCASCGIKLVKRSPKAGGKPFWGCSNYPRCRLTLQYR